MQKIDRLANPCSKNSLRKFMKKFTKAIKEWSEVNSEIDKLGGIIRNLDNQDKSCYSTYLMSNGSWSTGKPSDWETRPHVIELKQRNEELKGLEKQVREIRLSIGKLCHIDIDSYKERTEFFLEIWRMFRLEKKVQKIAKEAKKDASEESQSNKDAAVLMDMIIFFVLRELDVDVHRDFLDFVRKCYNNGCVFLVSLMVTRINLYKHLRWGDGGVYKTDISSVIVYDSYETEDSVEIVTHKLTKIIFAFYETDPWAPSTESCEHLLKREIITRWRPFRELKRCFVRHDNKWGTFFLNCYESVNPVLVEMRVKI